MSEPVNPTNGPVINGLDQPSYPSYGMPPAAPVPARKKRPKAPIIAVAALLPIGLGVAVLPRFFGADAQPSIVVSADAVVYGSFDLNPPLAQKAAAVQYLNKFPAFKGQIADQSDLRKSVFDQLQNGDSSPFKSYDYDTDIKPWLGDRFAIAVVPGADGEAISGIVLAVTDEAKATTSLQKIAVDAGDTECKVANKFAVCAEKGTLAQVMVADRATSLDASKTFTDDIAAVSGDAVATLWMDLGAVVQLGQDSSSGETSATTISGRIAGKLRFADGNAVELAGVTRGVAGVVDPGVPDGTDIGKLPASGTQAAVSINGLGQQLQSMWPEIEKQLSASDITEAEQVLNISIPDDLYKLFANHTTLAYSGMGTQEMPKLTLVTDGDKSVADKVAESSDGLLTVSETDSRVVVTTPDADGLADISGRLADAPAFKLAVPAADQSDVVVYVDLAAVLSLLAPDLDADDRANLEVLQAIGMSGSQKGADGSFTVRLTTK